MYALDLNNGAKVWRYPQDGSFIGGILNSPTVEGGIVYVGSLDGKVYAIDGNTITNGVPSLKWIFDTKRQGGFWATPVVTNDSVYIGGRDGYFYAIDKSNGSKKWEANIGAPILTSPSFDGTNIYFGAENMKAYAYSTNGTKVWESNQMAGQTMRGYFPVVTNSLVIFRTAPDDSPSDFLWDEERLLANVAGCTDYPKQQVARNTIACFDPNATASDSAAYQKEDQAIRSYLSGAGFGTVAGRPQYESFYALKKSDGTKPYIAPVLWTSGSDTPGVPPVITSNGDLLVKYRSYYSNYDDLATAYIMGTFGKMDQNTGSITILNKGASDPGAYSTNIFMIDDETIALSTAGNKLYTNGWFGMGSMDLTTGNGEGIIGARDGYERALNNNALRSFKYGAPPINFDTNAEVQGPPIFGDKVIANYSSIIAMMQGHLSGVTPTPIPTIAPYPEQPFIPTTVSNINIPSQTDLEKYIWEVPTLTNIDSNKSADLKTSLESAVNDFLNTGRLAPWIFIPGKKNILGYYLEPAQTQGILGMVLPYLSADLQTKVKTFVSAEESKFNVFSDRYPWDDGLSYTNGQVTEDNTKQRQPFAPGPFDFCSIHGPFTTLGDCENAMTQNLGYIPVRAAFDRLYDLWLYAYNTGDWSLLEKNWNTIKNTAAYTGYKWRVIQDISDKGIDDGLLGIRTAAPTSGTDSTNMNLSDSANRRLSALIAYARIAKHMNDQTEVDWATNSATLAMQVRLKYVNNFRPSDGDGTLNPTTTWQSAFSTWSNFYQNGGSFIQRLSHGTNIPQLTELTPEVGRLLKDYAPADVARYNDYLDTARPLLYLQRSPNLLGGEIMYVFPQNTQGVFLEKSLLANLSGDALRKYLDIPWVNQDYFYWERLARTIDAYGITSWVDVRNSTGITPTPTSTPTPTTVPQGGIPTLTPVPTATPTLIPSPTPAPCTLTSVAWSATTAVEGNPVGITVNGNNCASQTVNLEVRRYGSTILDDIPANQQASPSAIIFSSGSNTVSSFWIAEHTCLLNLFGLCSGDPQYYVKASVGTQTIDNKANMVTVTAAPSGGTGTTTLPSDTDWFTVGGNYQRTSWVNSEVKGPFNTNWYRPIDPYIDNKVQVVATNNTIFVSTSKGLYAFDADTGAQKWVYGTEMPLGNSPTVVTVNGILTAYVGGFDRRIHAINANTGEALAGYTPYEAGAGFDTNPLVVNNTIYAGNRDGYFYALDAITGNLKWRYKTDGPINYNAAYSAKYNLVYFASGDAYAYAVNANPSNPNDPSTILKWKSSKFPGVGFDMYWPVIYTEPVSGTDYVIFSGSLKDPSIQFMCPFGSSFAPYSCNHTQANEEIYASYPPRPTCDNFTKIESCLAGPVGNEPYTWASGSATVRADAIYNYYNNNPTRWNGQPPYLRVNYILNPTTGVEVTPYAPFNPSQDDGGAQGYKHPPVVGSDGVLYTSIGYYARGNAGCHGGISGWKFGTPYISRIHDFDSGQCDESNTFTVGGNIIYVGEGINAIINGQTFGAIEYTKPMGSNAYWGWDPKYMAASSAKYTSIGLNGKFGGNNGVYTPMTGLLNYTPVPYKGKVFLIAHNVLYAISSTGSVNTPPLPTAQAPTSQASFPVSDTPATLQSRLETEVQKMVDAGHLRPGFMDSNQQSQFMVTTVPNEHLIEYFHNPAETVTVLIRALPYLSSALQTQVKSYLQNNYGLLSNNTPAPYSFINYANIGWANGAKREAYDDTPEMTAQFNTTNDTNFFTASQPRTYIRPSGSQLVICDAVTGVRGGFPPESFYGAWKYAETFPGTASTIFNLMKNKLCTADQSGVNNDMTDANFIKYPWLLNEYIVGYKGYMELEKLAGVTTDISQSSKYAEYTRLVNLRLNNFSKDVPFDGSYNHSNDLNAVRNFIYLTPELADIFEKDASTSAKARDNISQYDVLTPYWFVSKYDRSYAESYCQPLMDYAYLYQARALIDKSIFPELVKYMDIPAFAVGDLYYIQNLTDALSAPATYSGPCTITSASWGNSSVSVGTKVNLNVKASGDCSSSKVTFEVDQYGVGGGPMGSNAYWGWDPKYMAASSAKYTSIGLNGKFGGNNGVYTPMTGLLNYTPVPYKGKVFLIAHNVLYAISSTGSVNTPPLPTAQAPTSQASFPVSDTPATLQSRLETEVQKMVDAGHLRPGFMDSNQQSQFMVTTVPNEHLIEYFHNPAETVTVLIRALPYLSSALQTQVKSYLQNNYGLLSNNTPAPYSFINYANIGWANGAKREAYDDTPEMTAQFNTTNDTNFFTASQPRTYIRPSGSQLVICDAVTGVRGGFPPESFYGAWKYAETFPGTASTIFNLMKNKLCTADQSGVNNDMTDANFIKYPWLLNEYIVGYKGYMELEKLAGVTTDISQSSKYAEYTRLVNLRLNNFSKDVPFDGSYNHSNDLNAVRNFIYLTPELADIFEKDASTSAKARDNISQYDVLTPYWFVSKYDRSYAESYCQPLMDYAYLYQARALIDKSIFPELVKYMDIPAFAVGDLYYIQNLTDALSAPATYSGPCTITSASWGNSSVSVGTKVNLNVKASGDCSSSKVTFEVDQYGVGGGPMSDANLSAKTTSFDSLDQTSAQWTTEYTPKLLGDPQYYFKVLLDGGTTWVADSGQTGTTLLTVTNTVTPTPTPVPTNTPSPTPSGSTAPSGGLGTFVTDTFTDTVGALLRNHTSDSGISWGTSFGGLQVSQQGGVRSTSGNTTTVMYANKATTSTDYDLNVDVLVATPSGTAGFVSSIDPSVFPPTYYRVDYNASSNRWEIVRAGSSTIMLATAPSTGVIVGSTQKLKLEVRGTTKRLLVKGPTDADFVLKVATSDATPLTETGLGGLFVAMPNITPSDTNALQLDNFTISDLTAVLPTPTPTPTSIPQGGTFTPFPTPTPCTISSVSWPNGVTSTTEGTDINVSITASGSCTGKQVHLTTRRNVSFGFDADATNQPTPRDVSLIFNSSNNTATASTTWKADPCSTDNTCGSKFFTKGQLVNPDGTYDSTEVTTDRNNDLTVTQATTISTSSSDWPQLQHDSAHTGRTAAFVDPNYEDAWVWLDKNHIVKNFVSAPGASITDNLPGFKYGNLIARQVQPIVANGKVFFGDMNGTVFAVNAATGDNIWDYTTGGPILHTLAYDSGTVVVPSMDGKVYGLDENSGALKWSYQTGAPLKAAPVISNGTVYIGSQDGYFYAFDVSSGNLKWKYATRVEPADTNSPFNLAPIVAPAAVSEDGSTVFFGAENMFFYALNTSNGSEKWAPKKLVGQSFKYSWPVVKGNLVIIRPISSLHEDGSVMEGVLDSMSADPSWTEEKATMSAYLQANPQQKSIYLFNIDTGQEPYQVAMGRLAS
ncbi:MAG: PQQ-binding-like beta-propeller repeat protein, partial [Patescibacteria group bacterium]|nr:PQQ-binding-like beta-propeller repeat protein [Patescibacteria group bacterium]